MKYETGWDEEDFAEFIRKFKSSEEIAEPEWFEAWKYAISTMDYDEREWSDDEFDEELEAAGLDYEAIRGENIRDEDMMRTLANMAENYEGQFEI